MTFSFYLFRPQKDVTPSKQKPTPIQLVISHKNKQYKKLIGISVKPCEFTKQRAKKEEYNHFLRQIEIRLNERLNQFSTPDEIHDAIEYAISGRQNQKKHIKQKETSTLPSRPSFWEYFQSWAERESTTKRSRKLAYNNIAKFMGKRDDWEDIDSAFHYRLPPRMNDEGVSVKYKRREVG